MYWIPDLELLEKYGVKPFSDEEELSDQAFILYCFRKRIPVPSFLSGAAGSVSRADWLAGYCRGIDKAQLVKEEYRPDDPILAALLPQTSFNSPYSRDYTDLIEKLSAASETEFQEEYPWILVALCQQSKLWISNGFCSFKVVDVIRRFLLQKPCYSVELHLYSENRNAFFNAVFDYDRSSYHTTIGLSDEADEVKGLTMLLHDALQEIAPFSTVDDPLEYDTVFIGGPVDGWDVIYHDEWYDCYNRIIYPHPELFENDKDLIREWLDWGVPSEIIDCNHINKALNRLDYVVVLDFTGPGDCVRFLKSSPDGIVDDPFVGGPVSFDDIKSADYSINQSSYGKPDNPDGLPLVEMGELCEIDNPAEGHFDMPLLPYYDYTGDFQRICINASHPRMDRYYGAISSMLFKGPHVHVKKGRTDCQVLVSHTPGYYHCQVAKSFALRVKDNRVSEEYLAYAITRDLSMQNFLMTEPSEKAFLRRKIAIEPDRREQDQFIRLFLDQIAEEETSDTFYNLLWVDPDIDRLLTPEEQSGFEAKRVSVRPVHSVSATGDSLDSALNEKDSQFNAVILEAGTDVYKGRLKGLQKAMDLCKAANIPIYVYSDIDDETLDLDLQPEQFAYLTEGRVFRKSEKGALGRMIAAIRKELDGKTDSTALLRSQFRREFLAAEWLDENKPKYNLHLVSDMGAILAQPNKSLNLLRSALRSLYMLIMNEISNRSGLEDVDLGAIPALLDDKVFKDDKTTKLVFFIRGEVLPKTLARSLRFATDIVNGASHGETNDESGGRLMVYAYLDSIGTENLSHAVMRIFFDLVIFLRECECKFDGYCESIDPLRPEDIDWKGVLKKVGPKEYCCETEDGVKVRVLVNLQNPPSPNRMIRLRRRYPETALRNKYQWCIQRDDWEYID